MKNRQVILRAEECIESVLKVCAQNRLKPAESLGFRAIDTPIFPLPHVTPGVATHQARAPTRWRCLLVIVQLVAGLGLLPWMAT